MKPRRAGDPFYGGKDFRVGAGDQDIMAGSFVTKHGTDNFRNLAGRLPFAENHLGIALTDGAVVIDLGKPDIFEGQVLETFECGLG